MGNKIYLTAKGAVEFNDALDLLYQSLKDFNQVASKMVPERILMESLSTFLADFCKNLEIEKEIVVEFLSEENIDIADEAKITYFTCIREIINLLLSCGRLEILQFQLRKLNGKISLEITDKGILNILKSPLINQEILNIQSLLQTINATMLINTKEISGNNVEIIL